MHRPTAKVITDPPVNKAADFADRGWVRAVRSEEAEELIAANPMAYVLATVIALRARWHDGFNRHGLEVGEAFLGDFTNYGMTARQYRTAKEHLLKWGFATFQTTNKGTIARLIDSRLFIVSNEAAAKQPTGERPAADKRPTTNKKDKKGRT